MPMYTAAMTFKLKPGFYDDYKKAHDELWPDLADAFRQNGVSMMIWHYEGRLFLYAEAPSREHFERSHPPDVGARWSAYMASMMECGEDGKAIVEDLDGAFFFGRYAELHGGPHA